MTVVTLAAYSYFRYQPWQSQRRKKSNIGGLALFAHLIHRIHFLGQVLSYQQEMFSSIMETSKQGSYEVQKTVKWIEDADFEMKIMIAGEFKSDYWTF